MKHPKVRQKYSPTCHIFNSLLGVSSGDETLRLMFDILLEKKLDITLACVASVSNRVIAQKLERKRKKKGVIPFFALFPPFLGAPNDRFLGNICSEHSRMAKIFESPRTAKNFENVSW